MLRTTYVVVPWCRPNGGLHQHPASTPYFQKKKAIFLRPEPGGFARIFFPKSFRASREFLRNFFLLVEPQGRSPETLRGGPCGTLRCVTDLRVQSPGGFARGGTVFRGLQPSEARLHRGSAERSEAARRSSGGRHYKKLTQKGSTRKPRGFQ